MSYVPHSEEANGLTLKIVADEDAPESPIEDDDAVILVVLHRRYINPAKERGLTTPEEVAEFARENAAEWQEFPLFLYDHSGTIYRPSRGSNPFSCPWDSGRVGSIFLKRSEFATTDEDELFKIAESTCQTYTDWANGNVFGYIVENENGDQLDSCWGYIGDYDGYVLEEGRRALASLSADQGKRIEAFTKLSIEGESE